MYGLFAHDHHEFCGIFNNIDTMCDAIVENFISVELLTEEEKESLISKLCQWKEEFKRGEANRIIFYNEAECLHLKMWIEDIKVNDLICDLIF